MVLTHIYFKEKLECQKTKLECNLFTKYGKMVADSHLKILNPGSKTFWIWDLTQLGLTAAYHFWKMRFSGILPFDLVRIWFVLMKSQERFDQNLVFQCENWGRAFVHISVLRVATGKGLVWGGATVTVKLVYGTSLKLRPGRKACQSRC